MRRGSINRSGETARVLILVGLLLQLLQVLAFLFIGIVLAIARYLSELLIALAIVGFLWIALVYLLSYARAASGDYEGARGPTLLFAVLSLITLGLIAGILYIVAYVKLGDATMGPGVLPRRAGASTGRGSITCPVCGQTNPPNSSYCRGCHDPLR